MAVSRRRVKRLNVTVKLLFYVFAVMLAIIVIQFWLNIHYARQQNEAKEKQHLLTLFYGYGDEVRVLEKTSMALASSFADRPDVQNLLMDRNRQGLLELLSPIFAVLKTNYNIVHFYIHDPSGFVFLRVHDPDQYGDAILTYRQTNVVALKTQRPVAGVELDPNRLGVRGIAPIQCRGQFIGLVEVGLDYDQAFIEDLSARHRADYRMWVAYAAAAPTGLWPKGDEPRSPSSKLFYYASTDTTSLPIPEEVYLQVLQNGEPQVQFVSAGHRELAVLVVPLLGYGDRIIGILEIVVSRAEALAALRRDQITTLSVAGGLTLLALVLMGISIELVVLRSLRHLTAVARRQSEGDLTARVKFFPNDELGELGATLNQMTEQLSTSIHDLEHQVETIKQAEAALRERAIRLELVSHIGQRTISFLEVDELLHQAVDLIDKAFSYYNVNILLKEGEEVLLKASTFPELKSLEDQVRLRVGVQGVTGWVAESGEPLVVPDVSQESRYCLVLKEAMTRSELAVPIKLKGRVIGVLDVQSTQLDAFSQMDLFTLQTVADQLAIAIENARLYQETHRRAERLAVVNRIGRAVGAILNLDDLMEKVYQEVIAIFQTDAFFIALYDQKAQQLDFRIRVDEGIRVQSERRPLGGGLISWVIARKEPLLVRDLEQEGDRLPAPEVWGTMKLPASWLGAPMLIGERLVGVICVQAYRPHVYGEEEQLLLSTIADQVAVAVESARLYEEVRQELNERQRLEEQLVQAQKMEAVGRLAGGIAHDFNNLLTAIIGYTDLLLGDCLADDPAQADLQEIRKAANRAATLTSQLLAFSRKQILQPRLLDLNAVVADMEYMLRRLIGEDIDLVTILDPSPGLTMADPGQIQQVIMNLAVNARDAMPHGGRLTIETSVVDLDTAYTHRHVDIQPGSYVMLAVSDTGVGMDEETQRHLFEPFFTTKERDKGTGLGLAMVHGVVKQSGGSIYVYSEPGRGTTFKVYLPCVLDTGELLRPDVVEVGLLGGVETILLVEDEEMVRDLAQRVLTQSGYTVLVASRVAEAIRICQEYEPPIQLLVTDVVMPGGASGPDLARHLLASRPQMQVLYISGYTDNAIVHHGVLDAGAAFLQKPFTPNALTAKVRQVLDARA